MAAIINRTPTGRLISLHAELKYLETRYGNGTFTLNGMKYDTNSKFNPLMYFPLAKKNEFGIYDPYLSNQLSAAKFHLTQSVQYDSQKSKSVSECLNALEALGWVVQEARIARVSKLGKDVAKLDYFDKRFFDLARTSVLGYGVFIGFIYKILRSKSDKNVIKRDNVVIGYADTHETIKQNGRRIPLSTGSQRDTIIRTRSTLFAWAVTTGFLLPLDHKTPSNKDLWHVDTLDIIKQKHWAWNKLRVFISDDFFNTKHYVTHPLSYTYMTKSTKALRERGQEEIRGLSLSVEKKVKNRRFAIVFALGEASERDKRLDFNILVNRLSKENLFVIDKSDFIDVMQIDKDIAITSGIPFIEEKGALKPLTKINMDELKIGAPDEVITSLTKILNEKGLFVD